MICWQFTILNISYNFKQSFVESLPGGVAAEEDDNDAEKNDWQVDLFTLTASWTESLEKNRIYLLILACQVSTGLVDDSIKIIKQMLKRFCNQNPLWTTNEFRVGVFWLS